MKPIIKDIKDITDSKEMYESKPHPFLGIFIYMVLGIIIIAGIWAYYGEIDIVSKGVGIVRPNENLSSIRNKTSGEIEYIDLAEGKSVKKGDILFRINHDDLDLSLLKIQGELDELKAQGNRLAKLKQSVEQGENLFSAEKENEDYQRYVKYEQDYAELKHKNSIESSNDNMSIKETEISKSIYRQQIDGYEKEKKELEEYKASINAEKNLFSDISCANALEFQSYLYEVQAIKADIKEKDEAYKLNVSLNDEGFGAKQDLENTKRALELAENKLITLKTKTLNSIESQIEELKRKIETAKQESSKLIIDPDLVSQKGQQRELALKTYKTNYLINLYDQIETNKQSYKAKEKELEATKLSIKNCEIVAPIDGVIHMTNKITKGDLITAGDQIATIIPAEDSLYTIEIFVPNNKIAGLKVGDKIKYRFDALSYKEYGELEGKITNISTDSQVNELSGMSGYIVEGSIVNQTVYSYKGEAAEIKIGMSCEAHVITEQKKILYYLLEKINLRD